MDAINDYLSRLMVRDVQLSTTKCILDRDTRLLSIYGWSHCLTREVVIALTIVDDTDQLEWTCMIESVQQRRAADEPFQVKIPSSSKAHEFVVTTKALRRISDSTGETDDVKCYEVTSESSCTAKRSSTGVERTTSFPVFDVRPHLRSNVGIRSGSDMLSILTAGSRLPTQKSKSFTFTGDSVKLQIYQGDSRRVSRNKPVHSIGLEFQSKELEKTVTLTLHVTEDGTLLAVAIEEDNQENTDGTKAPRIIDVICPKIAIDTTDPKLQVEWTRNLGLRKKAVLDISTTYEEIDRWRVSVAETGVATGNGGGHVFLFPRNGFSQPFEIPSNTLKAGVSYEVTVEGLQLIDDRGVDASRNFRIICRKSTTLKPTALPARTPTASFRMPSSRQDYQTSSVEPMTSFRTQRSSALQVNLDLQLQIERSTFNQASVIISTNPRAAPANRKWKISVKKIATTTGPAYYSQAQEYEKQAIGNRPQRFDFPLQFEAGSRYRVTVAPMECSGGFYQNPDTSVEQTAEFRAELTLEDINELYRIAVRHTARYGSSICKWLYRNKSRQYFDNILENRRAIMEVYDKDNSGDPASPINLQIKGLFFLASVERGTTRGEPISVSPFGPLRIRIPALDMLAMASNVYFVDFYCMRGLNHQVTLVMTRPGSKTDRFCAERLLLLDLQDPTNNPFFFYDSSGQLRVSTRDQLLVELLFTEDLDIRRYTLEVVETVGRGSSTPGGIRKKATCTLCNLRRHTAFPQF